MSCEMSYARNVTAADWYFMRVLTVAGLAIAPVLMMAAE
jgi:hypothetical protein